MIRCFGEKRLLICTHTNVLILSETDLRTFDNIYLENKEQTYRSWACSGLSGGYLYSCVEVSKGQYKLIVHNAKTKRIEYFAGLDSEIVMMEHHPGRNLLVTSSRSGEVSFWRP